MMRKIIVDSVKYWTQEYKVDGFRFDLMGIIDTETVQEAYDEVAEINPKTLFIGEGWRMYSGPGGTKGADQDWMDETNDVAVFSANFELYGDMSNRVMTILSGYSPAQEIYSIDECFLDLEGINVDLKAYRMEMKQKVEK